MICKALPQETPHAERRSRGLNAEINRLIWERMEQKIPKPGKTARRPTRGT